MTRRIIRAVLAWAFPELRQVADELRCIRSELTRAQGRWSEWTAYVRQLGEVTMLHEQEVSFLKIREATGASYAALDRRLARVELMIAPPVFDGAFEVNEQLEKALEAVSKGSA